MASSSHHQSPTLQDSPASGAGVPARIQVMSDLHLETPRYLPMYGDFAIAPRAPHLALLGDVGNAHDPRLYAFLERQLRQFAVVFYVLGNHEPYCLDDVAGAGAGADDDVDDGAGGVVPPRTYNDALLAMRRFERANEETRRAEASSGQGSGTTGQFVFMDRRRFDLSDDVTVLGCTLFSHITPEQESTAALFVSDFASIPSWDVDSHNASHVRDLAWLNDEVCALSFPASITNTTAAATASTDLAGSQAQKEGQQQGQEKGRQGRQQEVEQGSPQQQPQQHQQRTRQRRVLILTHYSPTSDPRANDPEHLEDARGVQSAFVTDLRDEPCWRGDAVAAWAFGHTHFNCDFVDEIDDDDDDDHGDGHGGNGGRRATGKRVVANQRGYGREEAYDFDADKVIEI